MDHFLGFCISLSKYPNVHIHFKLTGVRNNSDMTESSSSLYQESKRARLDREKEEKRKRLEQETEFSAEDLSLATVPGIEFDPKQRSFDLDELRPQPIIKKRRKLFTKEANKVNKIHLIFKSFRHHKEHFCQNLFFCSPCRISLILCQSPSYRNEMILIINKLPRTRLTMREERRTMLPPAGLVKLGG